MNVIRLASPRADRAEIEAQAQAWVVRLDGGCTEEELAQLGEWLGRTPLHRQVFRETASVWVGLDGFAGLLDLAETLRREQRPRRRALRWLGLTGGAVAAVLALWLALPLLPQLDESTPYMQYSTAVGEVREQPLPDGSTISLNTNTQVSVSYRPDARVVHLSSGEAYFEVAHDPERPFWVYSGKYAVRAVGTAFSVHSGQQGLDVIVTDGRIEVSAFAEPLTEAAEISLDSIGRADSRVPLDKGQMGVFSDAEGTLERVSQIDAGNLDRSLSWRDGMLIFDNDPLAKVVEELSRYTALRLVISDAELREKRWGGMLPVGDINLFLATLEQDYAVRVDRVAPDLVYLSLAREP